MAGQHACIVGAFEHPTRKAPDKTVAQLHAECALGALRDAGLDKDAVDGYFCAGDAPGVGPLSMVDYMNLRVRHVDATEMGGCSYLVHVAHAAHAIAAGKCNVALITLAGRPRSEGQATGTGKLPFNTDGGGLCSNHPSNRGGLTKVVEAVRQLRGEAHPKVQVANCDIALAHGTGGSLGTRHGAATVIMERK